MFHMMAPPGFTLTSVLGGGREVDDWGVTGAPSPESPPQLSGIEVAPPLKAADTLASARGNNQPVGENGREEVVALGAPTQGTPLKEEAGVEDSTA